MPQKSKEGEVQQDIADQDQAALEMAPGASDDKLDGLGENPFEVDPDDIQNNLMEFEVSKLGQEGESRGGPTLEELLGALQRSREEAGQISELSSEEDKIVEAFSSALLSLMRPLVKAIPVDPSVFSMGTSDVKSAHLIPEGSLLVLYEDGQMASIVLHDRANRDLMIEVVRDVMPKFNEIITRKRIMLEKRMGFISSVTKELQGISEALASTN